LNQLSPGLSFIASQTLEERGAGVLGLVFGVQVRVVSVDAVVFQVRVVGGIALQVNVVHVQLQPGLKVVAKTLVNDFKNLFQFEQMG
jgi:hypothetical protein